MKLFYLVTFLLLFFLNACSTIRESAGVNRKSIDEYSVFENPPLVLPPDYNLLPPDQLEEKNIDELEKELAKEILFGLDQNQIIDQKQISTMNQILNKSEAFNVSDSIREMIDRDFNQEIKSVGIFQNNFENDIEVLDAIKESERIRNQNFDGKSIAEGEVFIKQETIKKAKKKRFFFF